MVYINYNNNNIKLNDIEQDSKISDIKNKLFNFNNLNYFLSYNGKILKDNLCLKDYNITKNSFIDLNFKLNGGVFKILQPIFKPIIQPFKDIVMAVVSLTELLFDIIELFINLIEMIPTIFTPDKLINDIIFGISLGINSLFEGLLKNLTFKVPNDKPDAGMIFGMDSRAKKVCVAPTFLNLIILVLCPPLALFIDRGIRGIFLVIICCLMTYFLYYFPGLIFAALHILC